jgi:chorismate dehydratase
MLHGAQRDLFELEFRIPSQCADRLASGEADIGIVPSFELTRQDLDVLPGAGIACHGPVRSILLISRRPPSQIRTLAVDASSRTSVQLARVILERKYNVRPEFLPHPPDLDAMLGQADAALIIGDPALRVDLAAVEGHIFDLGADWVELSGYPMVFAVWAARKGLATAELAEAFRDSCRYGRGHMEEIVQSESASRGFSRELVREYLTRNIVHELGPRDYQGMQQFLAWATAAESESALTGRRSG